MLLCNFQNLLIWKQNCEINLKLETSLCTYSNFSVVDLRNLITAKSNFILYINRLLRDVIIF